MTLYVFLRCAKASAHFTNERKMTMHTTIRTSLMLAFAMTILASATHAKELYLVEGRSLDAGPLLDRQQVPHVVEGVILPSFERIMELEKEGVILGGGLLVGDRAGAYIFQVENGQELNRILQSLPFWGLCAWEITPLQSTASRLAQDREFAKGAMSEMKPEKK